MRIQSIFKSISGEVGFIPQGSVATFIRLQGCNLRCGYCDTPQSQSKEGGREIGNAEILSLVAIPSAPNNIVVTGGEPLLQSKDLQQLLYLIRDRRPGVVVQVETNGTLLPGPALQGLVDCWVFDYKMPSSGWSPRATDVFEGMPQNSFLKFVCGTQIEVVSALQMSALLLASRDKQGMPPFQPCVGAVEGLISTREVAEALIASGHPVAERVILNTQLHKYIWPDAETEV